jgi:hypothetical protein
LVLSYEVVSVTELVPLSRIPKEKRIIAQNPPSGIRWFIVSPQEPATGPCSKADESGDELLLMVMMMMIIIIAIIINNSIYLFSCFTTAERSITNKH